MVFITKQGRSQAGNEVYAKNLKGSEGRAPQCPHWVQGKSLGAQGAKTPEAVGF